MRKAQSERDQEVRLSNEALLALAALVCFAVALPVFDLLGKQAEFFAVRGSSRAQVTLLALLLAVVLPLVVIALPAVLRTRMPRTARALYLTLFVAAASLALLTFLRRTPSLESAWPLAIGVAALLYWAQRRFALLRSFLALLAVSLLVAPALFLFDPRVKRATLESTSDLVDGLESEDEVATGLVIFVLFDEWSLSSVLSADPEKLGQIRPELPNLARLAEQSYWFEDAQAVTDVTVTAVPAILTGAYPKLANLPILADYPGNLFTLFARHAEVRAWEPLTRLCPVDVNLADASISNLEQASFRGLLRDTAVLYGHLSFPPALRARLPAIDYRWSGFDDRRAGSQERSAPGETGDEGDTVEVPLGDAIIKLRGGQRPLNFKRFLESIDGERRLTAPNQLFFLHSLLPHKPWEYLPSGAPFTIDRSIPVGINSEEVWDNESFIAAQAFQRYLLQVEYVDSLIGDLTERLKSQGLFDEALIVITADHGVAFRPGLPRRVAVPGNETDIAAVPMLIKLPRQKKGTRVQQPVSVLDILPTVANVVGLDVDWQTEGRSLLEYTPGGIQLSQDSTQNSTRNSTKHATNVEPSADFFFRGRGPGPLGPDFHQRKLIPWRPSDVGPDPRRPQALPQLLGVNAPEQRLGKIKVRLVRGEEYAALNEHSEELRYLVGEIEIPPEHHRATTRAEDSAGLEIPADRLGIAVSIDGSVVATTWAFPPIPKRSSFLGDPSAGQYRFAALLGEGILKPGFNDLTIQYARQGAAGRVELVPTSFATSKGMLAVSDLSHAVGKGYDSFVLDDESMPLQLAGKSSGIVGFLRQTQELGYRATRSETHSDMDSEPSGRSHAGFSVEGWAIDKTTQRPVERIFLFYRDELVTITVPSLPQRWVVENHGLEAYLDSGFDALIPSKRAPELHRFGLEAVAYSAGRAAILDTLYPKLTSRGTVATLYVGDGRQLELDPASTTFPAWIDQVRQRDDRLVISGWAADLKSGTAAEAVVLFRSGAYETHLRPRMERSDLTTSQALPLELERSGFRFRLGLTDVAALLNGELELIAISEPGDAGSRAVRVVLESEAKLALEALRP